METQDFKKKKIKYFQLKSTVDLEFLNFLLDKVNFGFKVLTLLVKSGFKLSKTFMSYAMDFQS